MRWKGTCGWGNEMEGYVHGGNEMEGYMWMGE